MGQRPDHPDFRLFNPSSASSATEKEPPLQQHKLPPASRNPLPCGVILVLLIVSFGVSFLRAQSSLNEIHVVPRAAVSQFSAPALTLPNYESVKPIKVNVNLVLVPVTVTDPMDRA